ncbi:UV excision repair protein rad23 [Clarireedia jacksonii]
MPFYYNLDLHLPRRCHPFLPFICFEQPTNIYGIDLGCEGEDLKGERMGGIAAEVDLFRYAWIFGGAWFLAGWRLLAQIQLTIHLGKILQDSNTVESYKIEEKGFIVCMVSKPKAAPAASSSAPKAPSTPAPATAATPAPPAAPAQSSSSAPSAVPATPSPAGTSAPPAIPATPSNEHGSTGLTMGAERAAQIAQMESMGFERSQIDLAMRAAFYNSERAIEYLLNGIPENLLQEQRQPAPAAGADLGSSPAAGTGGEDEPVNLFEAAATAGGRGGSGRGAGAANILGGAGAGAGGQGAGLGNLDFLRNNPQFQQLRQVVQQQPQMLEPILQQVGAGNPQLATLISQHQDQFLQLLSENADDDAPLPPGAQAIEVTEAEREAIERLCRLGFNREAAIQAYFACDKNEELAANFLFEQPEDEE